MFKGSFSAVSKPLFASTYLLNISSKYSCESYRRDLQDLQIFAPLRPRNFSKIVLRFFKLIFFAKLVSLSLILVVVQLIIFLFYIAFSDLNLTLLTNFILLNLISNFGLISFGILIFLLTNTNTSKSFLFPLIFFPFISRVH